MTAKQASVKRARRQRHEYTSRQIAEIAARGLNKPQSLSQAEIKAVCGSALTQARRNVRRLKKRPPAPTKRKAKRR